MHSFSPALVRLAARSAAKEGYQSASEDLLAQAGVSLEGRQIQRLVNLVAPALATQFEEGSNPHPDPIPILYAEVDGTGVPMVAEELAGRSGKQEDASIVSIQIQYATRKRPALPAFLVWVTQGSYTLTQRRKVLQILRQAITLEA